MLSDGLHRVHHGRIGREGSTWGCGCENMAPRRSHRTGEGWTGVGVGVRAPRAGGGRPGRGGGGGGGRGGGGRPWEAPDRWSGVTRRPISQPVRAKTLLSPLSTYRSTPHARQRIQACRSAKTHQQPTRAMLTTTVIPYTAVTVIKKKRKEKVKKKKSLRIPRLPDPPRCPSKLLRKSPCHLPSPPWFLSSSSLPCQSSFSSCFSLSIPISVSFDPSFGGKDVGPSCSFLSFLMAYADLQFYFTLGPTACLP